MTHWAVTLYYVSSRTCHLNECAYWFCVIHLLYYRYLEWVKMLFQSPLGLALCCVTYEVWNKVRELIAVKVLHTSLLNTTVVAFKVLPLWSYAPMSAPCPPFKTILELVLWNGLQSCRCITPDVINVNKMPSFQYFLYLREQKNVTGG